MNINYKWIPFIIYNYIWYNIHFKHTIDATTCPTEPAATRYPNALDRSSTGTLCANKWKITGKPNNLEKNI